ncbi:MAG: DUF5667 domain-containing protein [Geodermatophilaceae bacterium]
MSMSDVERFAELVDPHPRSSGAAGEAGPLLALVSTLREMDFDVSPSEPTRDRQRQRLVAMAAVRAHDTDEAAEAGRHRAQHSQPESRLGRGDGLLAWLRQGTSGRRLIAGTAGLSVVVATLGILAFLAQSAIPGDTLYALKRGTEQARLVLAGSERAEGQVLLGLASTRLEELVALLEEPVTPSVSGSGVLAADNGAVAELLMGTMDTMDRQTAAGTNVLTTAAIDEGRLPTLQFIGNWGIDQFTALDGLTQQMPQEARTRAAGSKDLLQRVVQRLELLAAGIGCDTTAEPSSDDLGPLPTPRCPDPANSASPSAAAPTSGSSGTNVPESSSGQTSTSTSSSAAPRPPADPPATSTPAAPPPVPREPTASQPNPNPRPIPIPIPIPVPIPTQSTSLGEPPQQPPPPPVPGPDEGQPCVLIGFLGIEIPGIIIGGICIGLGG